MQRDEPACWTVHLLVYLQRGPAFYLLCTIDDYTGQLAVHRMRSAALLDARASKPVGFDADREVERGRGWGGSGEPLRRRPASGHAGRPAGAAGSR